MKYRMIFSDMDGTLVHHTSNTSGRNEYAIRRAIEAGVQFVLCTGRDICGAKPLLEQLDLLGKEGFVICQNGAVVYRLKNLEVLYHHTLSVEQLRPLVEKAREYHLSIYLYDETTFITEEETEEVHVYGAVMRTPVKIVEDVLSYADTFTKCLLSGEHIRLEEFRMEQNEIIEPIMDCFYSHKRYLEFVKSGINKGQAMKMAAEAAGVPLSEVIAIGDNENDLSMISLAGLGVAVANADHMVKDIANAVTKATCTEDAVAELIDTYIFGTGGKEE